MLQWSVGGVLISRTFPSFQLGTVTLAGWLVGWWLVSRVACLSVRAINRSTSSAAAALRRYGALRKPDVIAFTSVI